MTASESMAAAAGAGAAPSRPTLLRGLIEVSNRCAKDCRYCGIRRGNRSLVRYRMAVGEVLACADEAVRRGYPAVALQAGEMECEENTAFYEEVLRRLPPGLEVTLSLGEQEEEVYRRWKDAAGGRVLRYLLRIESSSREIYSRLHPADCSFDRRLGCIRTLKRLGYVTGSGVLIGVPGQTVDDLRRDVDFFESERLDMVGMGPWVPHPASPLAGEVPPPETRLRLALAMIREVRRRMPQINIVAATALEALAPGRGRALGLRAGANVVMPDITPGRYRESYDLYPGKAGA